jgi:NAD(P)-dependent dehydrogenase (short-subunit alcohol dehydrogenase family)
VFEHRAKADEMTHTSDGRQRVAVVTGGAGAIGGAIATALGNRGHRVVIVDRSGDVACDLADAAQVRAAADMILLDYGRCDVLVHAAGAFDRMTIESFDLAAFRRVQAVNVEAMLLLAEKFAPGMGQRGFGRIISIVSNTFWLPPAADLLAYVASKGALIGLTRVLAHALGPDGISVTAVAPGLTRTPASSSVAEEEFEMVAAQQALPRPLIPDDVAATVAFLAQPEAAALTGQTITTDGGLVLR